MNRRSPLNSLFAAALEVVRARRARVRAGNADGKDECAPANSEVAPGGYPAGSLHGRHSKSRLAETSGGMVEAGWSARKGRRFESLPRREPCGESTLSA